MLYEVITNEVFILDGEGGLVFAAKVIGDTFDGIEFSVEILELVEHLPAPETAVLEIAHETAVEYHEVPGKIALHSYNFV